jgi:hypothetical protein
MRNVGLSYDFPTYEPITLNALNPRPCDSKLQFRTYTKNFYRFSSPPPPLPFKNSHVDKMLFIKFVNDVVAQTVTL